MTGTFALSTIETDNSQQLTSREEVESCFGGIVPESVRFQDAFGMYREGITSTKSGAAVVAEMKESTFVHLSLGRRAAEDYYKSQRLLKVEEEEILIWRCDILQRAGFPQSIKDVTKLAKEILQKWEPTATISHR